MPNRNKRRKEYLKKARSLRSKNKVSGTELVAAIVGISENASTNLEYWDNLAEHAEYMEGYVHNPEALSLRKMFNGLHDWSEYSAGVTELKGQVAMIECDDKNAPHIEVINKAITAYSVDAVKSVGRMI